MFKYYLNPKSIFLWIFTLLFLSFAGGCIYASMAHWLFILYVIATTILIIIILVNDDARISEIYKKEFHYWIDEMGISDDHARQLALARTKEIVREWR